MDAAFQSRRGSEIRPTIGVSGRSETTYDERVRLDLTYIRSWNAVLDLTILFRGRGGAGPAH